MAKKTAKKDKMGKNVVTSKKVETKKVQNKKVETKKVQDKKVQDKKVETKVEVKKVKKEKKGNLKALVNKVMANTPLVIALCVILVLVGALLFTITYKKVPKTSKGAEIVATIKGKEVTADDLYEELKENYGTDALINIIDTYIADKEVEVTKDHEEYVDEVVDYYKEYAEYYKVDLATFLASYVGINGVENEEQFREYVLEDYKKTIVVTNYIGENAKEEDLKKHYKENYSDKLTVKHILIEVDAEAKDKDKADKEAYDKAVKLIKKLKDTSSKKLDAKFEELAEDNSDDTATYSNGGLIENFTKKDVVEEFWKASEKLENGKFTTEPVKSTYGYHIILKVSSTPVEKYKDIKEDVRKSYAENKLSSDSTLMVKTWDEIRSQYKLSIEDDFIKKLYKKTIEDATKKAEK